jgi:hypothetical protein
VTKIYLASKSQFLGTDTRPSINDGGQIAFHEQLDEDFSSGIFLFDDDKFVTVADASGPLDSASDPQLNNVGVVVFRGFPHSGGSGIFTGSGGPLTTIADSTGPFSFFGSRPSINDGGLVAFNASLDSGGSGIFTGPDPVADRVIATGDRLRGGTVISASVCSEGLNGAGELAFLAQFEDGRTGIFVATPKS